MDNVGVYMGVDPLSIEAIGALILGILDKPVGDSVKEAAFNVLPKTLSCNNNNLSNMNISMGEKYDA